VTVYKSPRGYGVFREQVAGAAITEHIFVNPAASGVVVKLHRLHAFDMSSGVQTQFVYTNVKTGVTLPAVEARDAAVQFECAGSGGSRCADFISCWAGERRGFHGDLGWLLVGGEPVGPDPGEWCVLGGE